jgi:hypothetical protein
MRYGRSKYGSKKVTVDGIEFDSKREAARYKELKQMEAAGEIEELQMQVPYELIPAQYEIYERYGKKGQRLKDGKRCLEKACTYVADFVYYENGKRIVEDVKSSATKTKDYRLKRKLMLYMHGVRIHEV